MVACSVFLHVSSMLKLALLIVMAVIYLVLVQVTHVALYDNRDILLREHVGYV